MHFSWKKNMPKIAQQPCRHTSLFIRICWCFFQNSTVCFKYPDFSPSALFWKILYYRYYFEKTSVSRFICAVTIQNMKKVEDTDADDVEGLIRAHAFNIWFKFARKCGFASAAAPIDAKDNRGVAFRLRLNPAQHRPCQFLINQKVWKISKINWKKLKKSKNSHKETRNQYSDQYKFWKVIIDSANVLILKLEFWLWIRLQIWLETFVCHQWSPSKSVLIRILISCELL